jgi:hypothetical protein
VVHWCDAALTYMKFDLMLTTIGLRPVKTTWNASNRGRATTLKKPTANEKCVQGGGVSVSEHTRA